MAATYQFSDQQIFDASGDPIVGATLESYASGTSTPLACYSDEALTTAIANPANGSTTGNQVTDASGRFGNIYLQALAYKFVCKDGDGATLWTHDTYNPDGGSVAIGEVPDSLLRITDDGDSTKKIAFQASGISTGTTRTLTVPDASGTLALVADFDNATVASYAAAKALTAGQYESIWISDANRGGMFLWRSGDQSALVTKSAKAVASISTGSDTLTVTAHDWYHGVVVRATATEAGLTSGADYYVEYVDADTIKLHTTYDSIFDDAEIVDITGTVSALTLTRVIDPAEGYTITPNSDNSGASGVWTRLVGSAYEAIAFGVVGDDATDSTEALQHAINYVQVIGADEGRKLKLPQGRIVVSRPIYQWDSGLHVEGAGKLITQVRRTADYGDTWVVGAPDPSTVRLSNVGLTKLTLFMAAEMTTGRHLLGQDFIHGDFSQLAFWNGFISIQLEGAQNSSFAGTVIKTGTYYTSATVTGSRFVVIKDANNSSNETGELFFSDFNWTGTGSLDTPIEIGLDIQAGDGIWFDDGHIFRAETEHRITPQGGTMQLQGLRYSNVWFDQKCTNGIVITGNSSGGFGDFFFTGCKVTGATDRCVDIDSTCTALSVVQFIGGRYGDVTASSGQIFEIGEGAHVSIRDAEVLNKATPGATTTAISVASGVSEFCATNNTIGTTSGTMAVGIQLAGTTTEGVLAGNSFIGVTSEIVLPGAMRSGQHIYGNSSDGSAVTEERDATHVSSNVLTISPLTESVDLDTTAGSQTINAILHGWDGRRLIIRAQGANSLIVNNNSATDGTAIRTHGGGNITMAAGETIRLIYHSRAGAWFAALRKGDAADFASLKVGGTAVIDSSRNADFTSLKVGGTTVVDSSRNIAAVNAVLSGKLVTTSGGVLTVTTNSITVTGSLHSVDTSGSAQIVYNIVGGADGQRLILRASSSSYSLTLGHNGGSSGTKFYLAGSVNFVSSNARQVIELLFVTALSAWVEISRSANG